MEKAREFQTNIWKKKTNFFFDYTEAFDSMDDNKL